MLSRLPEARSPAHSAEVNNHSCLPVLASVCCQKPPGHSKEPGSGFHRTSKHLRKRSAGSAVCTLASHTPLELLDHVIAH